MQRLTAYLRSPRRRGSSKSDPSETGGYPPTASDAKSADEGDVDLFAVFHAHLTRLRARPRSMATPMSSMLELQMELLLISILLHPGDADRIGIVLNGAVELVAQRPPGTALDASSACSVLNILA